MVAFNTVKVGDVLWDCRRQKMGHTTMRQMASWPVSVKEIDTVRGKALCSWNYNEATWWSERQINRLRRTPAKKR